jgi:hypothetical protein
VLAARAIIATAAGLDNTLDEATVTTARFPIAAIDQKLILKVALSSFAIHVI